MENQSDQLKAECQPLVIGAEVVRRARSSRHQRIETHSVRPGFSTRVLSVGEIERRLSALMNQLSGMIESPAWQLLREQSGSEIGDMQAASGGRKSRFGAAVDPANTLDATVAYVKKCLAKSHTHPYRVAFESVFKVIRLLESVRARADEYSPGAAQNFFAKFCAELLANPSTSMLLMQYLCFLKAEEKYRGISFTDAERIFARWEILSPLEYHTNGVNYVLVEYLGTPMIESTGPGRFRNKYWHRVEVQPGDTLRKLIDYRWELFPPEDRRDDQDIVKGLLLLQQNPLLSGVGLEEDLFAQGVRDILWAPPEKQQEGFQKKVRERQNDRFGKAVGRALLRQSLGESPRWLAWESGDQRHLLKMRLARPPKKVEDPPVEGPLAELRKFNADLESDLELRQQVFRRLLGSISQGKLVNIEQQNELKDQINWVLDRLGLAFATPAGDPSRLRVKPERSGSGSFQLQTRKPTYVHLGAVIPDFSKIPLVTPADLARPSFSLRVD